MDDPHRHNRPFGPYGRSEATESDRLEDLIAILDRSLISLVAQDATPRSDLVAQLETAKLVLQAELNGHFQRAARQLGDWTNAILPKGGDECLRKEK